MNRNCLIFILLSLLTSSSVFAQKEKGAIEGTIKDAEARPIPGVMVTASSPALIGESSITIADQNGFYRFPFLTPGNYDLKIELNGFQKITRKDLAVSLGITLTIDFTLEMSGVAESIEITANPPLIDSTTTAVSFTIPNNVISNLPKLSGIQDLMRLTPGVSDDLVAFGSDGSRQNSIWVDGVNVSDPKRGGILTSYDYNWIEAVQVTGIGAPAEYGGFTGVLGNFITHSGGNQFHGLFETFFQNENLASTNVPDPEPEVPFNSYDFSAQLGGPIFRDRLWFFSAIEFPHLETRPFGYPGVITDSQMKFITKLTYKWNADNTLSGFAHLNQHSTEGLGAAANVLPEATKKREDPQSTWNASWISILNSQNTFEGRIGGFHDNRKDIEVQPDLAGHYDMVKDIYSVNAGNREHETRTRFQANGALSHHADDFIHGGHDFRFGIQFEHSNIVDKSIYNGGMFYFDYAGMPFYRYVTYGYMIDGTNHAASTYVQDEWNINDRFTASLGVRWDHNRGSTDRGLVFKNDPVAPRIGFIWNIDQTNQTVIKAHFGDYYQSLLENNFFFLTSGIDTVTGQIYDNGNWITAFVSPPPLITASENLKQPFVRQFTGGIDRVLPADIPVGIYYIYRRWQNILGNVALSGFEPVTVINPLTGEPVTVFTRTGDIEQTLFTNPAGLYRRYDGLEIYASKNFHDRCSLSGSLVYSRLQGNIQNITNRTVAGITPNTFINFPGALTVERPLQWKIVGTYLLPWGFNAGWYLRHESGDTWTAIVTVHDLKPPNLHFLGEPAGSRQLPSRTLLDIRFEKEFQVYHGQLRWTMDLFNIFNSAYVTDVNDSFESSDFSKPIAYNDPRQIRLGVRYTF